MATVEVDSVLSYLGPLVTAQRLAGVGEPRLRVRVIGGGCSGMTYVLDIVDEPDENDKVIEDQGMKLFVDRKSYVFLAGTTLDYSGGMNGKGFVFNNPNAKTTCGCGTSFAMD